METISTPFHGLLLLAPHVFKDSRGYFAEVWNRARYAELGIDCKWVQDNEAKSTRGVLRGLHYQIEPFAQAKLVRVISGEVQDVVVDLRKDSPTFGRHFSTILSSENKLQLYIPRGFAHGYAVLSAEAIFAYKCDNPYNPASERGIAYNDPTLDIDWMIPECERILSEKDRHHPLFGAI